MQQIVQEEALKAGDYASNLTLDFMKQVEKDVQAKGMTVNEVDLAPFVAATESVYKKFGYEELRKQITAIIEGK